MGSEILINVRPAETRVAFLDNSVLTDLTIDRKTSPTLVGSIHRGKVLRVLPGMQAAFVDIGLDRAAFLYVGDVRGDADTEPLLFENNADEEASGVTPTGGSSSSSPASASSASGQVGASSVSIDSLTSPAGLDTENLISGTLSAQGQGAATAAVATAASHSQNLIPKPLIQELLTEGQALLVQVAKDPIGTKGARITTHISLAGRHLVFMPTLPHQGVSRRIEDQDERERLRQLIQNLQPKGGVIIRTAGEGATEANLRGDLEYLHRLWEEIQRNYEKRKNPGLVHAELDVELRALRDMLGDDVARVWVDDEEAYRKIVAFLGHFMPKFKNRVKLYAGPRPLFDSYEIDLEISRAMERKVWLKSGGYIVLDEAEALVVIDVNTGRYVGKKDLEDTILKTNLEAVREIAHQIRIRNCGGIIIVDFIDMEREAHREQVMLALREEIQKDRARTTIFSMSNLGLVEMTRKRIRPSLVKTLCETCSYCDGRGFIKKKNTVAHEIFRELEREAPKYRRHPGGVIVQCHSGVGDWIYEEENEMLEYIENKLGRNIILKLEPSFHVEEYEIFSG